MKPIECLNAVYNKQSYNYQFGKAAIYKGTTKIAEIEGSTYIRQGGMYGGIMTVLSYDYIIEDIQSYGVMTQFNYGHYDFFGNWQRLDNTSIVQYENDSIEKMILKAIDSPKKDLELSLFIPPYKIVLYDCYNKIFD